MQNYYFNSNLFTNSYPDDVRNEARKYLDPIHGYIGFDQDIWQIIDTPQFQRLREIKQLGISNLVFGGATHTRFEHSLGVGYLAQKYMKQICKNQPCLLDTEEKVNITRNVTIAGLCHDIGHGPFSHLFENVLHQLQSNWSHEQMSTEIFTHLIDSNNIDIFSKEDEVMIKNLIKGDNPYRNSHFSEQNKAWIFDIVANKRNSIDVDKFDYLQRDAYHIGYKDSSFDYKTIMKNSLIIDGEICYNSKLATKIYDLFQTRYRMFKQVYLNRISVGIELMIKDIILYANPYFNFTDMVQDVESYLTLNDSLIHTIENSKNVSLTQSQSLLKKLKTRDIYKFVNEVIISTDLKLDTVERMKQDIICYSQGLKFEDIEIYIGQANYAFEDKNPVDFVKFYKKPQYNKSFYLNKNQVSLLLPSCFSEKFLRIYVKNKEKVEVANKAFVDYCHKSFNQDVMQVQSEEKNTSFNTYYKNRTQYSMHNTPIKKHKQS